MQSSRGPFRANRATLLLAVATILGPGWAPAAEEVHDPKSALVEALEAALALRNGRVKDGLLMDGGFELARARLFKEARRAADAIGFAYWPPVVLSVIAEEQAKAGDVASALRTAGEIDAPGQPDLHDEAIGRIALALSKAGDLKRAIETIRLCRRPLPSALAIGALMSARAEAGDLAGALSAVPAFDALETRVPWKGQALAGVARILAARGDLVAADRLARDYKEAAPLILAAIAEARDGAGDPKGAAGFARRVMAAGADRETEARCRVVLIRDLAARGRIDEAKRIVEESWKKPPLNGNMGTIAPSLVPLESRAARAIAGACAERGEVERAQAALSHLAVHDRVWALIELADRRTEAGDRATAERLLTVAERSAESGKLGFYHQDLGAAQFRFGRRDASRGSFAKAMRAGDIGTPVNQRVIVATQARAGDVEGATRTVAMIDDPGLRDQARAWIAIVLARQGRADVAIDATRSIIDRAIRATAMAQAGKILGDTGDPDRAVAAARRAAEIAGTGGPPPHEAARIIAHAWASTTEGFPEAQGWARRLGNVEARASALLGVAQGGLNRAIRVRHDSHDLVPTP